MYIVTLDYHYCTRNLKYTRNGKHLCFISKAVMGGKYRESNASVGAYLPNLAMSLVSSAPSKLGKQERVAELFILFMLSSGRKSRMAPSSTPRYAFIPSNNSGA